MVQSYSRYLTFLFDSLLEERSIIYEENMIRQFSSVHHMNRNGLLQDT